MNDYHTHTSFSADSEASVLEMIEAAIDRGIHEIAITDHYDPLYPDLNFPFDLDRQAYTKMLDRVSEQYSEHRIRVVKGIELGMQTGLPARLCAETAASYDYDFIIGSVHSAFGASLDTDDYLRPRTDENAVTDYYDDMLASIGEFQDFDVLGHINYIDRYVRRVPEPAVYMERVDRVLKLLVELGKGMEINTSCYRYNLRDTTPPFALLQRFRELGGEIITIGSDAHRPEDIGYEFKKAAQLAKDAGFKYVARYAARVPSFSRI